MKAQADAIHYYVRKLNAVAEILENPGNHPEVSDEYTIGALDVLKTFPEHVRLTHLGMLADKLRGTVAGYAREVAQIAGGPPPEKEQTNDV